MAISDDLQKRYEDIQKSHDDYIAGVMTTEDEYGVLLPDGKLEWVISDVLRDAEGRVSYTEKHLNALRKLGIPSADFLTPVFLKRTVTTSYSKPERVGTVGVRFTPDREVTDPAWVWQRENSPEEVPGVATVQVTTDPARTPLGDNTRRER